MLPIQKAAMGALRARVGQTQALTATTAPKGTATLTSATPITQGPPASSVATPHQSVLPSVNLKPGAPAQLPGGQQTVGQAATPAAPLARGRVQVGNQVQNALAPQTPEQKSQSDLDKLYQQMMQSANDQWNTTQQLNQANMAALERRTMAMQGEMGRSVAGGFAGAMGGAFLQGNQQMNEARAQHEQAMNQLQMNYLTQRQNEQWREQEFTREGQWHDQAVATDEQHRKEDRLGNMQPGDVLTMMIGADPAAAAWLKNWGEQHAGAGYFTNGENPDDPGTWSTQARAQAEQEMTASTSTGGGGFDPMKYA